MANKIKFFSQVGLAVLTVLTLNLAIIEKPTLACGGSDETNSETEKCIELVAGTGEEEVDPEDSGDTANLYFDADTELVSEREVRHSFFLAGNQVESKDNVEGISFVAGNLVEFSGSTEYAALAGNSVKVSGSIEEDLFVAGNAIELTEDAYVGRDLYLAANTVLIKSNLYGNAFVGGNRLVLENVTIEGNFHADFDEIVIKGKSSITGVFEYNDNAKITGLEDLSTGSTETFAGTTSSGISFATTLEDKVIFLLGRLLVTIILIALTPKFAKKLLDTFNWKSSWKHLALGLGLICLIPICSIFIFVSIIGLPLGILAMVFWGVCAYLATSITGGVIGDQLAKSLFKKPKLHIFAKYTIGIVLIELLSLVPVVGGLTSAISVCFGFGYSAHRLLAKPKK